MKITVTQEDIDKGEPRFCFKCSVAIAVTRAFGAKRTAAEEAAIFIHHAKGQINSFLTPSAALRFIRAFDARQPVQPFEFELV